MPILRVFRVSATWDAEAGVWVAGSRDVLGLATWARTKDELSDKLAHLVPGCFAANGQEPPEDYEIVIDYS